MEDTTLKQVEALNEKNRRDIWADDDRYIWYWDVDYAGWICLSPVTGGTKQIDCAKPSEGYGPYTRILKGWR